MSATVSPPTAIPTNTPTNPDSESAHPEPDDDDDNDSDNPELEAAEQPSNGPRPCGEKLDYFTHSPVGLSDFMGITPVENLGPPGHT